MGLKSLPVGVRHRAGQLDQRRQIDLVQLATVAVLIAIGQNFAAVLLVLLESPPDHLPGHWLAAAIRRS